MSRFFKYSFLLIALVITVQVVFVGFSYYSARRSLDAEIEGKRIGSLEYLQLLARKEADLVWDYLETRCRERSRLALYQIGNGKFSTFPEDARKAYLEAFKLKNALVNHVERRGGGKVDIGKAREEINRADFYLSTEAIAKALKKSDGATPADHAEFMKVPADLAKDYLALFEKHRDIFTTFGSNAQFLDVSDIRTIEYKLERIKAARAEINKKLTASDWEELLSRYAVWTAAFVGLNDLPADAVSSGENQSGARLAELECEKVLPASKAASPSGSKVASPPNSLTNAYNATWRTYFSLPPIAQTLFVTLFLGAMGALTFNVLRLSRVGWWSLQADPMWGELLLSPLLGALAAFGIFLLGSTGLLLTSDLSGGQSGAPALSAYFIGLLGFVSGLLYDQAFGRVRQFGEGLFAQGRIAIAGASAEDKALAAVLKAAGAAVVSELVVTFGLGSRLSQEKQFTLVVPSDSAMDKMSLGDWRQLNSTSARPRFELWFQKHHAPERLTLGNLTNDRKLKFDDGSELDVVTGANTWKIGKATVTSPDLEWTTGVVHLLDQEP